MSWIWTTALRLICWEKIWLWLNIPWVFHSIQVIWFFPHLPLTVFGFYCLCLHVRLIPPCRRCYLWINFDAPTLLWWRTLCWCIQHGISFIGTDGLIYFSKYMLHASWYLRFFLRLLFLINSPVSQSIMAPTNSYKILMETFSRQGYLVLLVLLWCPCRRSQLLVSMFSQ